MPCCASRSFVPSDKLISAVLVPAAAPAFFEAFEDGGWRAVVALRGFGGDLNAGAEEELFGFGGADAGGEPAGGEAHGGGQGFTGFFSGCGRSGRPGAGAGARSGRRAVLRNLLIENGLVRDAF